MVLYASRRVVNFHDERMLKICCDNKQTYNLLVGLKRAMLFFLPLFKRELAWIHWYLNCQIKVIHIKNYNQTEYRRVIIEIFYSDFNFYNLFFVKTMRNIYNIKIFVW